MGLYGVWRDSTVAGPTHPPLTFTWSCALKASSDVTVFTLDACTSHATRRVNPGSYHHILGCAGAAFGFRFNPGRLRCSLSWQSFRHGVCDVQTYVVHVEWSSFNGPNGKWNGVCPPRFSSLECAGHAIAKHSEPLNQPPSSNTHSVAILLVRCGATPNTLECSGAFGVTGTSSCSPVHMSSTRR